MRFFTIPNALTLMRLGSGPIIASCIYQQNYQLALLYFILAACSDWLDGYFARRFHQTSKVGAILDPIADKFLMISVLLTLNYFDQLELWLVIMLVTRDVLIIMGTSYLLYQDSTLTIQPLLSSKINTFLQISLIIIILLQHIPELIIDINYIFLLKIFKGCVVFSTIYSSVIYLKIWWRKFCQLRQA